MKLKFSQRLKLHKLLKNKKILLCGVFIKKDENAEVPSLPNPTPTQLMQHYELITIAPTPKDASLAIDKLIYFNHFDHFNLWCQSHGYTDTCSALFPSWEQYKRDVIGKEDYDKEMKNFSVFTLTYSQEEVSSILRTFFGCKPLLLPIELPVELQNFLSRRSDPTTNTTSIPIYLAKLIDADTIDGPKIQALLKKCAADKTPK